MYAGERLAGCESAAIDERREAAHAIIRHIKDIELAAAAAAGGASLMHFSPIFMQACGFTTLDPAWGRASLIWMLRMVFMYCSRFILGESHYLSMYQCACDWGAKIRTLYSNIDFSDALPLVSVATTVILLGDLPISYPLYIFPMLNYMCTIVCREVSPCWVNLMEEQRMVGDLPPHSDGNGWAAFLAAFCQRHNGQR
jgi:hypothetical protein